MIREALLLSLLLCFFHILFANVPAASCAPVSQFDYLEEYDVYEIFSIKPKKDCKDKVVCQIFCPRLNHGFRYNATFNSSFSELLDLTGIYNQTSATTKSFELSCLARYLDDGVDDWTDPNSLLFREWAFNLTGVHYLAYFHSHILCENFTKIPDVTTLNPDSFFQYGFTWEQIRSCFMNFDDNYVTHLGFNSSLQITDALRAILLYKDTFKGFQRFCLDKLFGLGLTGQELKNKTLEALKEYEHIQRTKYNSTVWLGDEFKNPYYGIFKFDQTWKQLEANGSLHLLKPIYEKFVDKFSDTVLKVDNRRYCRCESVIELLDREIFNDLPLPPHLRVYGNVSTLENQETLATFVDGLFSLCRANGVDIVLPKTSPKSSPSNQQPPPPQLSGIPPPPPPQTSQGGTFPPPQQSQGKFPPPQTSHGGTFPPPQFSPGSPPPQTSHGGFPPPQFSPSAPPPTTSNTKSSPKKSASPVASNSTRNLYSLALMAFILIIGFYFA